MLRRSTTPSERGQITIIAVFVVFVFLGLAALAVDVGNWFVHHRHLQTQVDAAALASAQNFTGCFLDPALTNPVIRDAALQFAGDLNRVPGAFNAQVKPVNNVHVVLNSASHWPNGTDFDLGQPCDTKFLDVKATDDDTPNLLGIFDLQPDIRANARVEIRKADSYTGVLPWAIPEVDPGAVVALFVNEATGLLVHKEQLTKGAIAPLNGTSLQRWGGTADLLSEGGCGDNDVAESESELGTGDARHDVCAGGRSLLSRGFEYKRTGSRTWSPERGSRVCDEPPLDERPVRGRKLHQRHLRWVVRPERRL